MLNLNLHMPYNINKYPGSHLYNFYATYLQMNCHAFSNITENFYEKQYMFSITIACDSIYGEQIRDFFKKYRKGACTQKSKDELSKMFLQRTIYKLRKKKIWCRSTVDFRLITIFEYSVIQKNNMNRLSWYDKYLIQTLKSMGDIAKNEFGKAALPNNIAIGELSNAGLEELIKLINDDIRILHCFLPLKLSPRGYTFMMIITKPKQNII